MTPIRSDTSYNMTNGCTSPLQGVGPKKVDYFLDLDQTMEVVLGLEKNSKVGFLLTEVDSKKIGYFLEPHYSIVEWDSWVDFPLVGLDS